MKSNRNCCYSWKIFLSGHALGQDQEECRGGPRSADDGVLLPVPVLAPVLRARRALGYGGAAVVGWAVRTPDRLRRLPAGL